MPQIVDYDRVVQDMQAVHLQCLYHNSGAFGFDLRMAAHHRGWIGEEDPSIRPEARVLARRVAEPYVAHLTRLAVQAWQRLLQGEVWLMPKSHWAYELQFGSQPWLGDLLGRLGVDAATLEPRADGSAIAFTMDEAGAFEQMLVQLLENLRGSDFSMAFPGRPVICTVHHHGQLWWSTADAELLEGLDSVAERAGLMV